MPLHPQKKPMGGMFDRLDDSIRCQRAGCEVRTNRFYRLMMGAIHLHARALHDSSEQTTGHNRDAVGYPSGW